MITLTYILITLLMILVILLALLNVDKKKTIEQYQRDIKSIRTITVQQQMEISNLNDTYKVLNKKYADVKATHDNIKGLLK